MPAAVDRGSQDLRAGRGDGVPAHSSVPQPLPPSLPPLLVQPPGLPPAFLALVGGCLGEALGAL